MTRAPDRPARVRRRRAFADRTWADLVGRIGTTTFRLRTLLGVSQQDLARAAGVSQGAISRVEGGRCASTPLLTYLKVYTVLAKGFTPLAAEASADLRRLMGNLEALLPLVAAERPIGALTDPGLLRLVTTYSALRTEDRARYVALVAPIADVLAAAVRAAPEEG